MRRSPTTLTALALVALTACGSDSPDPTDPPDPPDEYDLTVTTVGDGSGTVTSSPDGIDCPDTCEATYEEDTSVTLTATPDEGSGFEGWSGGGCSGTDTCEVTLTEATGVTATFGVSSYTLTVERDGAGTGTVTSDPPGIDCGDTCIVELEHGTSITLTAVPDDGFVFAGWDADGCEDTGPCAITLTSERTVTATFEAFEASWPDSYSLYCSDDGTEVDCPGGNAGQDGNVRINVPVYTTIDGRVHDSVTGLTWERLPPFEPINKADAATYCMDLELDGFDDWRLPSRLELASLVDYGRSVPTFTVSAFPNIPQNSRTWSSTEDPGNFNRSYTIATNWGVATFTLDEDAETSPGSPHFVRCVRGPALENDLSVEGGTVMDAGTDLMWQDALGGLTTWGDALEYCEALELDGYDDWRLPSKKEWLSIVDDTLVDTPRIPLEFTDRPDGEDARFWSSTPLPQPGQSQAFVFNAELGTSYSIGRDISETYEVRCVR